MPHCSNLDTEACRVAHREIYRKDILGSTVSRMRRGGMRYQIEAAKIYGNGNQWCQSRCMLISLASRCLEIPQLSHFGFKRGEMWVWEIVDAFAALIGQEEGKRRCLPDMIKGGRVGGQVERFMVLGMGELDRMRSHACISLIYRCYLS